MAKTQWRVRKLLSIPWLLLTLAICATCISNSNPMTKKPGCPTHCGNLAIPYPFGIGPGESCSMSLDYSLLCNTSFNPPKLFHSIKHIEIVNISLDGQIRIKNNNVAVACYGGGKQLSSLDSGEVHLSLIDTPFQLSNNSNKLTLIGCEDLASIDLSFGDEDTFTGIGCGSSCRQLSDAINGSCTGKGCCDISIPKNFKEFSGILFSDSNHTNVSYFNPCGYAFVAEEGKYIFNVADLSDPNFVTRTIENVPIVLDWVVGGDETCSQARKNSSNYACQKNSNCTDLGPDVRGYRCNCLPGFEGNPYLSPGCIDGDECNGLNNICTHICTNTHRGFNCSCPDGQIGDGFKNGTGCVRDLLKAKTNFANALHISIGFGLLVVTAALIYLIIIVTKIMKRRDKLFKKNGGLLLKQKLSQNGGNMEACKIFRAHELRKATNRYSVDRILGTGGYGTVYKGIIKDGREVAVKKSRVANQNQIAQFINELVILTQINHRHVVKLLGCCLETEVPLLVYEFIAHGTLYEHLHDKTGNSWLSWPNCLRIAAEAADAISYLHSAASIPIIHRDVKSSNILIDDRYTARISDFGASRFVPIDQTGVTTIVQGTLGYLDPEYYETSQLTEKSDVYSFGVVLAEILTKEQPLSLGRGIKERNLASYFVLSMNNQGQLFEILDHELVKEASEEHLLAMCNLIRKCLNVKGEDRPTMREVANELASLKNQIVHPWADMNGLGIGSIKGEHDLYPKSL